MALALRSLIFFCLACAVSQAASDSLIVLNKSGHDTSFIDVASGDVRLTLPTGPNPHEVAVSPDGKLAVVANYGDGSQAGHTLTVIDLTTGAVKDTIDLKELRRPHGVQFLADSKRVAVTIEAERALIVVNVDTGEVVQRVQTDAAASHMVAVAHDKPLAFVANIGSGSLSVIDLDKGELLKTISTGDGCEGVDITPDGKQVWTTNRSANTLSVIDVKRLDIVGEISCADFPIRIKFTPDGQRAVVSCAVSSEVAVYDVRTRKELARIPLTLDIVDDAGARLFGDAMAESPAPVGVLIDPSGSRAYIAATNADRVVVIDLETYAVVGSLVAGSEPDGLGWAVLAADD